MGMKSMVGLGFGFGAMDEGLEAAFDRTTNNLDQINDILEDQSKTAKRSFLPKFFKGIGKRLALFNLGSMASNMQALTGDTNRLTNSIESFGVQAQTAISPVLAQMGLYGAEAGKITNKITGMAYSTNISAGTIAESFKELHEISGATKESVDSFGFSLKDWVKISQVTGMSTEQLIANIGDLSASWGLSGKETKALLDDVVGLGQASGLGAKGLLMMQGNLEAMDKAFAASMFERTPETIAEINTSIIRLAGAFRKGVGDSAEAAMSNAQAAFSMFAEEVKTAEERQKGLTSSYGDFTLKLMQVMDKSKALKILAVGTRDPLQAMTLLNQEFVRIESGMTALERQSFGRFKSELAAVAPNMSFLTTSTERGTAALEEMSKMSVKTTGSLKQLGKGYKAGITLAESLDRAKESFETMIRSISRADVRDYVRNQRKSYRELGAEWKKLGKDQDSLVGGILRTVSAFDQLGVQGLFMKGAEFFGVKDTKNAQKFGLTVGYAVDKVNQFAQEFQPVVSMISTLGPFGALGIAGGIATWFLLEEADRRKVLGSWYPMLSGVMDIVEGLWNKIPWDMFKKSISKMWDRFLDEDVPAIKEKLSVLWNAFVEEDVPIIKDKVFSGLSSAFDMVVDEIGIGKIAIGAAIITGLQVGGFTTAFGGLLTSAVAGAGIGVVLGELINDAFDKIREEREKLGKETRETFRKYGKVQLEEAVYGVEERRKIVTELSTEELTTAIAKDLLPTDILEAFTAQQKDFVNILEENAKIRQQFLESAARREGVEVEELDIENYTKLLEKIQMIPEIQEKLSTAMQKGSESLANQFGVVYEGFASKDFQKSVKIAKEYEEQRALISSILEQGETFEVSTEYEINLQSKINSIMDNVRIQDEVLRESGVNTAKVYAEGIGQGATFIADEVTTVLDQSILGQIKGYSPPEIGPLSGTVLYDSGANILLTMTDGMVEYQDIFKSDIETILSDNVMALLPGADSVSEGPLVGLKESGAGILRDITDGMKEWQPEFKKELSDILTDSVLFAVTEFQTRVVEEIKKKTTFLDERLKELMETEVYKRFIAEVEVKDTEGKKAAREVAAIALSDSGLLGVKNAIVAQTGSMMTMLHKIEENTRPLKKRERELPKQLAQPS